MRFYLLLLLLFTAVDVLAYEYEVAGHDKDGLVVVGVVEGDEDGNINGTVVNLVHCSKVVGAWDGLGSMTLYSENNVYFVEVLE